MLRVFDEGAWERALSKIREGRCTPFIGAGASAEYVPVAGDLAAAIATKYRFPFDDNRDLARVTQYATVCEGGDRQFVKQRFCRDVFEHVAQPHYDVQDEPHAVLADLGLPIYITTNYDDFMFDALAYRGRLPQRAICPWYTTDRAEIAEATKLFEETAGYNPDSGQPIVYHLHGHHSIPESMVLTEDDYIEFLVRISSEDLLPPVIKSALRSRMLLFVGFSLADWTFRVIFQGLLSARSSLGGHTHVSVQLPPQAGYPDDERPPRIQDYLDRYFAERRISVCWKTAREFSAELRSRWESR